MNPIIVSKTSWGAVVGGKSLLKDKIIQLQWKNSRKKVKIKSNIEKTPSKNHCYVLGRVPRTVCTCQDSHLDVVHKCLLYYTYLSPCNSLAVTLSFTFWLNHLVPYIKRTASSVRTAEVGQFNVACVICITWLKLKYSIEYLTTEETDSLLLYSGWNENSVSEDCYGRRCQLVFCSGSLSRLRSFSILATSTSGPSGTSWPFLA